MNFTKFKNIFLATALVIGVSISFSSQAQNLHEQQPDLVNPSTMTLDVNTPFNEMKGISQKQIKLKIVENLNNQLTQYQHLGLYDKVNNVDFKPRINYGLNNVSYDFSMINLNISATSTLNHLKLSDIAFVSEGTIEQQETYDLQKTLAHELGHLQFCGDKTLLNNENSQNSELNIILNKQINTKLQLSGNQKNINTNEEFIQENIADAYGELAYMKLHNFDSQSISDLKMDLKSRISDNNKLEYKNGKYTDSHDTVKTLETLLDLVSDSKIKKILQELPGQAFDGLAKSIVFNTYKDYLNNPEIKKNINKDIQSGIVESTTKDLYDKVIQTNFKINLKTQIIKIREDSLNSMKINRTENRIK